MYSIELIQIPGGWAAHAKEMNMGAVSQSRGNAFQSLKNHLQNPNLNEIGNSVKVFYLPKPGHYLFKNFSNS